MRKETFPLTHFASWLDQRGVSMYTRMAYLGRVRALLHAIGATPGNDQDIIERAKTLPNITPFLSNLSETTWKLTVSSWNAYATYLQEHGIDALRLGVVKEAAAPHASEEEATFIQRFRMWIAKERGSMSTAITYGSRVSRLLNSIGCPHDIETVAEMAGNPTRLANAIFLLPDTQALHSVSAWNMLVAYLKSLGYEAQRLSLSGRGGSTAVTSSAPTVPVELSAPTWVLLSQVKRLTPVILHHLRWSRVSWWASMTGGSATPDVAVKAELRNLIDQTILSVPPSAMPALRQLWHLAGRPGREDSPLVNLDLDAIAWVESQGKHGRVPAFTGAEISQAPVYPAPPTVGAYGGGGGGGGAQSLGAVHQSSPLDSSSLDAVDTQGVPAWALEDDVSSDFNGTTGGGTGGGGGAPTES